MWLVGGREERREVEEHVRLRRVSLERDRTRESGGEVFRLCGGTRQSE